MEIFELFEQHLQEQNICLNKILSNHNVLNDIISILIRTRNSGNKVFTCGNGGSSSTASHFVSDLLKTTITKDEKIGILKVYYEGDIKKEYDVFSNESIKKSNIFSRLLKSLNFLVWGDA